MSIGLAPAARFFMPSVTMAWASTVAVVVPSPASDLVLVAASLRSCAPMFSEGSSSVISLATVTPSCVTVGAPNCLSRDTLRPLGPSVTFTASASVSIPLFKERRASSVKMICFAIAHTPLLPSSQSACSSKNPQYIALFEYQVCLIIHDDLGATIFGEQHTIAFVKLQRRASAVVKEAAAPDSDHRSFLRLLAGGVRNDDPTSGRFLPGGGFDDHAVAQWSNLCHPLHLLSTSRRTHEKADTEKCSGEAYKTSPEQVVPSFLRRIEYRLFCVCRQVFMLLLYYITDTNIY